MPLVSYSSSSGEDNGEEEGRARRKPAAKRQRRAPPSSHAEASAHDDVTATSSGMPPLPSAFHDLYAATVRQSTVDDPSLHHGRKRQVPHIAGQWPSHVYIEWRPSYRQHEALTQLLAKVEETLDGEIELHQFMTSDLGAPLPLHVSLSRPLSLSTAEKDDFLARISESLGSGSVPPFAMRPRTLAWFTSPDSDRSFLVLGVETIHADSKGSKNGKDESGSGMPSNQQLMELLDKSNAAAGRFGQPLLYQLQDGEDNARSAFHVSIAWTFAQPGQDLSQATLDLFQRLPLEDMMGWEIDVSSVKVKIGNTVTSVALSGRVASGDKTRYLFDES